MIAQKLAITDAALRAANFAGIYGDAAARVLRMVKRSAPVSNDFGNRRFRNFVFYVADGVVHDVSRLDPEDFNDRHGGQNV